MDGESGQTALAERQDPAELRKALLAESAGRTISSLPRQSAHAVRLAIEQAAAKDDAAEDGTPVKDEGALDLAGSGYGSLTPIGENDFVMKYSDGGCARVSRKTLMASIDKAA